MDKEDGDGQDKDNMKLYNVKKNNEEATEDKGCSC